MPRGAPAPGRGAATFARRAGPIETYFLSFNLYALGNGLVAVFLNLFFLANYSYLAVLSFQLATYVTALAAYLCAGYALPRYRPKHLYVLGLALFVFVLFDMLSASGFLSNAFVFGTLWGAATGVFYAGNNPMMHDITRRADRTSFVAVNNLLTGVVSLIAPVSAGALIQFSTFPGVERYLWDFAVTAGFFALAAITVRRVHDDAPPPADYSLARTVRGPGPGYARFQLFFEASQLFAIPFGIILPIYVFQVTGSYLLTGAYASYLVLLSVLANFGFRRGFRPEGGFAPIAVAGIVLSSLLLFTRWDPLVCTFLFAGCYTVLSTPLNNLAMVEFMQRIDRDPSLDRVPVWANREFHLGVGRIVVLGLLIVLSLYVVRNSSDLVFLLPFLSLYAVSYFGILPPRPHPEVPLRPAAGNNG